MPRSKNPARYDKSFFDALEQAARLGRLELPFATEGDARSARLSFNTLRIGIEEQKLEPYRHYVSELKFLVRGSLLVIVRGSDDITQAIRAALPPTLLPEQTFNFEPGDGSITVNPPAADPMESAIEKLYGFTKDTGRRAQAFDDRGILGAGILPGAAHECEFEEHGDLNSGYVKLCKHCGCASPDFKPTGFER